MNPSLFEKYSRHVLFAGIGRAGQERISASGAVLIGAGALGSTVASLLVRAGLGTLRIIDRDFVEASNLQRQNLYEESDAREALPKAIAAQRHLRLANPSVNVQGVVADITSQNALDLLRDFPLVLDGTDNFETRMLLNDCAISLGVPWIYAAVVGSYGVCLPILPGKTPCLACLAEADAESAPMADETCDVLGVLNAAAAAIAALETAEALKLLAGRGQSVSPKLVSCDVWAGRFQALAVARHENCRACVRREFSWLEGRRQAHISFCGRDSVQIHECRRDLDLAALGARLRSTGAQVRNNEFLLRLSIPPFEMAVFGDGRAVIKGTRDPAVARSLYARYIGA